MGPVVVAGAFDVPAGVFAFDDAWVGSEASGRVEALAQFADGVVPDTVGNVGRVRGGGKHPAGRWICG